MELVLEVTTADKGHAARVHRRPDGKLAVTITDLESGMTLPCAKIFAVEPDALAYAIKCCAD